MDGVLTSCTRHVIHPDQPSTCTQTRTTSTIPPSFPHSPRLDLFLLLVHKSPFLEMFCSVSVSGVHEEIWGKFFKYPTALYPNKNNNNSTLGRFGCLLEESTVHSLSRAVMGRVREGGGTERGRELIPAVTTGRMKQTNKKACMNIDLECNHSHR